MQSLTEAQRCFVVDELNDEASSRINHQQAVQRNTHCVPSYAVHSVCACVPNTIQRLFQRQRIDKCQRVQSSQTRQDGGRVVRGDDRESRVLSEPLNTIDTRHVTHCL